MRKSQTWSSTSSRCDGCSAAGSRSPVRPGMGFPAANRFKACRRFAAWGFARPAAAPGRPFEPEVGRHQSGHAHEVAELHKRLRPGAFFISRSGFSVLAGSASGSAMRALSDPDVGLSPGISRAWSWLRSAAWRNDTAPLRPTHPHGGVIPMGAAASVVRLRQEPSPSTASRHGTKLHLTGGSRRILAPLERRTGTPLVPECPIEPLPRSSKPSQRCTKALTDRSRLGARARHHA